VRWQAAGVSSSGGQRCVVGANRAGGGSSWSRGIGEKDYAGCGRRVMETGRLRARPIKSKKSFEIRLRIFPTTQNRKLNKKK
jgi:hypothetical protein